MADTVQYQSGFGNEFATEALPGALPVGQNTPQKVAYGLYAEQISGAAFTAPRAENRRSWFYRILPSVVQGEFKEIDCGKLRSRPFGEVPANPTPLRWDPLPVPSRPTDFVHGLVTVCGNGGYGSLRGSAVHLYAVNQSMQDNYFYNSDGEFLFVPYEGTLALHTEMGVLHLAAGEIAVVPRGVKFQVRLIAGVARGYLCENYGALLRPPERGPIGANGLANPRDFLSPVAAFEERRGAFKLITKFQGRLWEAPIEHSPLDVVAWHGNLAPYKYDLKYFQAVNSVTFDHNDPSIATVLTSPSEQPGTANLDFVIFPPRWLTMEHSFRPPYYHRNCMSEYMGLLSGVYEAKASGFVPGGGSLHNAMTAHGPDSTTFDRATNEEMKPQYLDGAIAFMFESSLVFNPTAFAMSGGLLQKDYLDCWKGLKSHFRPKA